MGRKNVIIITIDECKASAMSPYGNDAVITNTAERAAREGAVFENAFTCHPKCVPSRACLISGRYAHTGGHRTLPGFELEENEPNLAGILKEYGYVTGMFGKNHTVREDLKPFFFDEYTTEHRGANLWATKQSNPQDPMFRAFYRGVWNEKYDDEPQDFYHVEDSINFIEKYKDRNFFLLVNLNFPHPSYYEMAPYIDIIRERGVKLPPKHELENAPETLKAYRKAYDLEMLSDKDWLKIVEAYYSMVSYVDNLVGKIYDKVEELGLENDTVIIYTSDHGDFAGEHGCAEKYDTFFYECIIKIPLYIKYPPLIKPGTRFDSLTENVDIAPTVLDILGLPIPRTMHGKSLLPYIKGEKEYHKDEVFCEGGVETEAIERAPHYDSPECERMKPNYYWKQVALVDYPLSMQRSKMVRTKEWKLIYRQNGEKELYNLLTDPDEMVNLAGREEYKDIIFDLMERLMKWMIMTETDVPAIENLYA